MWFNDGSNGFQLLSPAQRIAAVGYAMMADQVKDGAIGSAQLASNLNLSGTTIGSFSGDGSGLSNIPASAIASPPPGMVLIPAGEFTMGDSLDGDGDATPAVITTISAYYMDAHEVTLSQWQSVYFWATSNGYSFTNAGAGKGVNHPVHSLNWYDCVNWCNARSEREGKTPVYYTDEGLTAVYKSGGPETVYCNWDAPGYRLPTEAEWEKASRGGLTGQRFPWGDVINHNLANYLGATGSFAYDLGPDGYDATWNDEEFPYTSPVGTFAPNGYGLYDMSGNVFEWCWDWYETPYVGGSDPPGPALGSLRVFRGGGWDGRAIGARCAKRFSSLPDGAGGSCGFRAVLSLGQP